MPERETAQARLENQEMLHENHGATADVSLSNTLEAQSALPLFSSQISRRGLFGLVGSAVFAPDSRIKARAAQFQTTPESTETNSDHRNDTSTSRSERSSHGEEHESWANDFSSLFVVGQFGRTLQEILRGKREGFDWETVKRLSGSEAVRLGALAFTDREALDHDIAELRSSYPLAVGVLVPLAEIASQLKVSNDRIFEDEARTDRLIREIGLESTIMKQHSFSRRNIRQEELDLGGKKEELPNEIVFHNEHKIQPEHDEPDIFDEVHVDENIETWEVYEHELQDRIVQSLARNAAVTATFAPIFTTYSSSAIADANHAALYKLVAKHKFARNIIRQKRHSESHAYSSVILPDTVDDMKKQATDQALSDMNGFGGFNHLNLALSANADGMGLLGDPPMLYFLQRHGPEEYAELSAKGLTIAQISNMVSNFVYLQKLGIGMESTAFFKKFLAYEGRSLSKIWETFTNGALRDVSFKGARGVSQDLTEIIMQLQSENVTDANREQLLERMREVPEPVITVDVPTIVKEKKEIVTNLLRREKDTLAMIDEYRELFSMDSPSDLADYLTSREFRMAVEEGNKSKRFEAMVTAMKQLRTDEETSELTALLESLLFHTVIEPGDESHKELLHAAEEHTVPSVESIMARLRSIPVATSGVNVEQLMNEIADVPEEHSDGDKHMTRAETMDRISEIYRQLGIVTNNEVRQAVEDALLLAEGEEVTHRDKNFLSHQADEVAKALLSQLPVTPALAHVITRTLGIYAERGEFTLTKLKRMTDATLGVDIVTSALADNVVAYLLTETVLEDLMRDYYGERYDENEDLQEAVWTSSVLLAMIAGANSKYGNGPNMLKREYDANLEPHSMELKGTLGNPYAILQTGAVFLYARNLLFNNLTERE